MARQSNGVKSTISAMNILAQKMQKKKPLIPSFAPLLATVQAIILDFGILVNFGITVHKLMLWLF